MQLPRCSTASLTLRSRAASAPARPPPGASRVRVRPLVLPPRGTTPGRRAAASPAHARLCAVAAGPQAPPSPPHWSVAEPSELFRLKCANDHYAAAIISTHFKRNNRLVYRVSARYNHGSTGSKQAYLARRRVYKHRTAHQLLIYRYPNIITNQVQTCINLYKTSLD
jgi:hypothetical protein